MKIRSYRLADAAALSAIHNAIYPRRRHTPASFQRWMARGHAWVIADGAAVGYTAVSPVPGLDGVYHLNGDIHPDYQRQGQGSRLLTAVLPQLPALGVKQLSHAVTNLDSPAAHFLRRHNFFIEHEEWFMRLPLSALRSPLSPAPPPSCQLQTHPSPARLFRQLYDQSFGGAPWYQPYSQAEAEAALDDPADIIFLLKEDRPIGFAWLRMDGPEIEPLGIVKGEQGRGYGRTLLLAALNELKQRGAKQVRIGVWRDNHAAVNLYQSLGFRREKILIYLALDLR